MRNLGRWLGALQCFLVTSLLHIVVSESQPEVELGQGVLRGSYLRSVFQNRKIFSFVGIPYAVPPVGSLRFKEAEPAKPWLGVLNATQPGPVCLQYSHMALHTPYVVHGSEDCLYLNVYTPKLPRIKKPGQELLNVIVYIHGGAFTFFSGYPFGPRFLLEKDVVLVTLNYRLGLLGFLSTEDEVVPGNNGLKDQLMAIKWVKKNIQKFGGDPKKITLAGTSAGGASVHYHVLSPQSKGLFTHGIIMSGSALNPWTQAENSLEKAMRLSSEFGCPTDNNMKMIECLRTRPAEQIVNKEKLFIPWLFNPFTPFGPVVEPRHPSAFISEQPLDIITSRKASDVPLLMSYTRDEGLYPGEDIIKDEAIQKELLENWVDYLPHLLDYNNTVEPERREEVAKKIKDFYLPKNDRLSISAGIIHMIGDRLFKVGLRETAMLHARCYESPTYAYGFAFKGSRRAFMKLDIYDGVAHADDLAYLVDKDVPWGRIGTDQASNDTVHFMTDLWMNFITDSMDPKWHSVRPTLPGIAYLLITGGQPQKNPLQIYNDTSIDNFWRDLKFNENFHSRPSKLSELTD